MTSKKQEAMALIDALLYDERRAAIDIIDPLEIDALRLLVWELTMLGVGVIQAAGEAAGSSGTELWERTKAILADL